MFYNNHTIYAKLDTIDPLTEIINSGQAFLAVIALERIIWLIIGIFFLGAITKPFLNALLNLLSNNKKSFSKFFMSEKQKDEKPQF